MFGCCCSWARDLNKLCWNEDICDDFSKLQSAAYLSHLQGTFDLQKERVQKSTEQFVKAKFIYETMIDIFDLKPDSDPMGTLESKSSGGKGKGRNKKKDANEVERQKRGEYYYAQVAEISKKLRYLQMQFDSPQTYAKFVETIETKFGEIVASQIKVSFCCVVVCFVLTWLCKISFLFFDLCVRAWHVF